MPFLLSAALALRPDSMESLAVRIWRQMEKEISKLQDAGRKASYFGGAGIDRRGLVLVGCWLFCLLLIVVGCCDCGCFYGGIVGIACCG